MRDNHRDSTPRSQSQKDGGGRRYGRSTAGSRRSDLATLVSERADDATPIEIRSVSNRVEITTNLPDCSRDDVRVSTTGAELRLWADPDDGEGLDRTITLATPVRDGAVDVAYDDPTLTVTVPRVARR